MNKIWIVANREFMSRVQKKTFLLTTILLPVIIFGCYALIIYFSVKNTDTIKIAVADNAKVFGGKINDKEEVHFTFVNNETIATLKDKIAKKEFDGYVWVPTSFKASKNDTLSLVTAKTIGLMSREQISKTID